jgi:hypothetical protein
MLLEIITVNIYIYISIVNIPALHRGAIRIHVALGLVVATASVGLCSSFLVDDGFTVLVPPFDAALVVCPLVIR